MTSTGPAFVGTRKLFSRAPKAGMIVNALPLSLTTERVSYSPIFPTVSVYDIQ